MIVHPPVIVDFVSLLVVVLGILTKIIGGEGLRIAGPFPVDRTHAHPHPFPKWTPASTGDNIASYVSWVWRLRTFCAFGFAEAFGFGEGVAAELPELSDLIVLFGVLSPSSDFPICAGEGSGSR